MIIQDFDFNKDNSVFVIAELSANHNGSLETALETIRAAKRTGANAIKLQTYTADTLTIQSDKDDFIIKSVLSGMARHFMTCIKVLIPHGNGMRSYFNVQRKKD